MAWIFTSEPAEDSFSADPVLGQVDLRRGRALYRFRTRRSGHDQRFARMSVPRHDHGSCPFASCT
jgi:hypothetical protein